MRRGGCLAGKHSPNGLRSYLDIHETVLQRFEREGFIDAHDIEVTALGGGAIEISGQIRCEGGLVCTVEKTLQIVDASNSDDPAVQTVAYAYNVHVVGHHNLLRYDNVHTYPGHGDASHRHAFDWRTGEVEEISWVGPEWPTLGEVLDEMRQWYWLHRDELS